MPNTHALLIALAGSVAMLASGCGPNLSYVTARSTGCHQESIAISNDTLHAFSRTWTATCGGTRYECEVNAGRTAIVTCRPRGVIERASTGGGAIDRAAPVQREERDGRVVLRARFSDTQFTARVIAAPREEPDRALLILRPRAEIENADACDVGAVIDGQAEQWDAPQVIDGELHVHVSIDTLRRMAGAQAVAGRVCDREWRLTQSGRTGLREFVQRFDEERAWTSATR